MLGIWPWGYRSERKRLECLPLRSLHSDRGDRKNEQKRNHVKWGRMVGKRRGCAGLAGGFLGGKWAGKGEGATGDGGRSSQAAGTPAAKGL